MCRFCSRCSSRPASRSPKTMPLAAGGGAALRPRSVAHAERLPLRRRRVGSDPRRSRSRAASIPPASPTRRSAGPSRAPPPPAGSSAEKPRAGGGAGRVRRSRHVVRAGGAASISAAARRHVHQRHCAIRRTSWSARRRARSPPASTPSRLALGNREKRARRSPPASTSIRARLPDLFACVRELPPSTTWRRRAAASAASGAGCVQAALRRRPAGGAHLVRAAGRGAAADRGRGTPLVPLLPLGGARATRPGAGPRLFAALDDDARSAGVDGLLTFHRRRALPLRRVAGQAQRLRRGRPARRAAPAPRARAHRRAVARADHLGPARGREDRPAASCRWCRSATATTARCCFATRDALVEIARGQASQLPSVTLDVADADATGASRPARPSPAGKLPGPRCTAWLSALTAAHIDEERGKWPTRLTPAESRSLVERSCVQLRLLHGYAPPRT